MKKNLYLVNTVRYRAYVLASDTNEACEKFEKYLNDNDYGYHADRRFDSIKVVASESAYHPLVAEAMSCTEKGYDLLLM